MEEVISILINISRMVMISIVSLCEDFNTITNKRNQHFLMELSDISIKKFIIVRNIL